MFGSDLEHLLASDGREQEKMSQWETDVKHSAAAVVSADVTMFRAARASTTLHNITSLSPGLQLDQGDAVLQQNLQLRPVPVHRA